MTSERLGYDYPSDEQLAALMEMAAGQDDYLSLAHSDPDYGAGDANVNLSILAAVDSLLWGEGTPDDTAPLAAKAAEVGFTAKEAMAALAAMSAMWYHLNLRQPTD